MIVSKLKTIGKKNLVVGFKDFYVKYRIPIFIGATVVSSVVIAYAIDKYVLRKGTKIKNQDPKKILIVGDSQSAIKNAQGQPITYTYPNILKKQFPDKQIDVLALGGKVSQWALDNLPSQLAKEKYDRVYIYTGGNDASNKSIPLEKTISIIQKMVDLSIENGADAFVGLGWKIEGQKGRFMNIDVLPVGRPANLLKSKEEWLPYVEKRKELQRRLPLEIKNANFVPVYDLKQKTQDGIHPTAEGHKIVAENYAKTIKS